MKVLITSLFLLTSISSFAKDCSIYLDTSAELYDLAREDLQNKGWRLLSKDSGNVLSLQTSFPQHAQCLDSDGCFRIELFPAEVFLIQRIDGGTTVSNKYVLFNKNNDEKILKVAKSLLKNVPSCEE
jgi:hypothetical protein